VPVLSRESPMELQVHEYSQLDMPMLDALPTPITPYEQEVMDVSEADKMEEDLVEVPAVVIATRIPSWKREIAASTTERVRTDSPYGLRERPAKKSLNS